MLVVAISSKPECNSTFGLFLDLAFNSNMHLHKDCFTELDFLINVNDLLKYAIFTSENQNLKLVGIAGYLSGITKTK